MGKHKKGVPAASTKQEVLVNVILDRSGSMSSNRDGTISGYNEYLGGLRADKDTSYSVSLIQFDSPAEGPELTVSYTDKPLADVSDLTKEGYEPRGMTPLYDAIGECVRRVGVKARAVLTVIITDGMENASREFTQESIKKLIESKEAEGWKFAFLGANIDSFQVGGSVGVAASYTANYAAGNEKQMFASLARATVARSASLRSHGLAVTNRAALFNESDRLAMGGRPPAPSPFRTPPSKAGNVERSRTKWAVRG